MFPMHSWVTSHISVSKLFCFEERSGKTSVSHQLVAMAARQTAMQGLIMDLTKSTTKNSRVVYIFINFYSAWVQTILWISVFEKKYYWFNFLFMRYIYEKLTTSNLNNPKTNYFFEFWPKQKEKLKEDVLKARPPFIYRFTRN